MKKTIININHEKCIGCGKCVNSCHQGAIQLINNKAVLVDEHHCDGLGRCLGSCPVEAISFIEKEVIEPRIVIKKPTMCCIEVTNNVEKQFPIQLHLIHPQNPQFLNADLLLAADCTAFVHPEFHEIRKGKKLLIACPKLDENQEVYAEKLRVLIDEQEAKSLTALIMEVPCCAGILHLVNKTLALCKREIPLHKIVVGIDGEIRV